MTLLLSVAALLVLALILSISVTSGQRKRNKLAEEARIRAEMRSNAKDVWAANVQTVAVTHSNKPIEYDTTIHVKDDLTDSQYQILKAIFAEAHPEFRSSTEKAKLEADYWADTDHIGLSHE